MPRGLVRIQQANHIHFVTFSCYRRAPKLAWEESRDTFCAVLEAMRVRWDFCVLGYVVMPEHVHLLLNEPSRGSLATALQMLKQTASLRMGPQREPLWMSRYYDFNVWSEEKVTEKLEYMHFNPVKRGVAHEGMDWRWSSASFYAGLGMGPVVVERSARLVLPATL
jgi:putative transposase